MKIEDFEIKAKNALFECFNKIPTLKVSEPGTAPHFNDNKPDIWVTLLVQGGTRNLVGEINTNGEPRIARQAANQIRRYIDDNQDWYGVFIAPYISPDAAAICQKEGIGYLDLAGNCHISFENIYIHVEGKPNRFKKNRPLSSLFSPKAERVLRVLLASGPKEWKTEELAEKADVSLGQIANVKKLLADQEWIDAKSVGFSLTRPLDLLEKWSQNYKSQRNRTYKYYTLHSLADFEYKLAEICQNHQVRYGLTGFSGSARYALAVRYPQVTAYVDEKIDELAERLEIKRVTSGHNVEFIQPYDEGVFYGAENRQGTVVVSPVQIYLDLIANRGRGQEAAEALLDQVIRKLW
jgi:hypothetical protein